MRFLRGESLSGEGRTNYESGDAGHAILAAVGFVNLT
jgi:hypothetical protein